MTLLPLEALKKPRSKLQFFRLLTSFNELLIISPDAISAVNPYGVKAYLKKTKTQLHLFTRIVNFYEIA